MHWLGVRICHSVLLLSQYTVELTVLSTDVQVLMSVHRCCYDYTNMHTHYV
jgi:hypothetical protein